MQRNDLEKLLCAPSVPLKEAMVQLNKTLVVDHLRQASVLVVDEERRLLGILTDGDIRRALVADTALETPVGEIMNRTPRVLGRRDLTAAARIMADGPIRQVPVVDNDGGIQDLITWDDMQHHEDCPPVSALPNGVVIMAGGKGSRLDPFTKILPKPLVPIGDKAIIELIMERCRKQGLSRFIVSVYYRAAMIRTYLSESPWRHDVEFVEEERPLGTAGALSLLKDRVEVPFIVTNCDILTDVDYGSLLSFHRDHGFELTVVGALKNFTIPYGVLKAEQGVYLEMSEKPEYDVLVNAGVYVVSPSALEHMGDGARVDMPELIDRCRASGARVGVYPFHGNWIDIGQWEEYRAALSEMGH